MPVRPPDGRVTPLTLDITNKEQIQRAVKEVESLDVLVNNAGVALVSEIGDRVSLEAHRAESITRVSKGSLACIAQSCPFLPTINDLRSPRPTVCDRRSKSQENRRDTCSPDRRALLEQPMKDRSRSWMLVDI